MSFDACGALDEVAVAGRCSSQRICQNVSLLLVEGERLAQEAIPDAVV